MVGEGLGRAALPPPRQPAELDELEALVGDNGGLDFVVPFCIDACQEWERGNGRVTKGGKLIEFLRDARKPRRGGPVNIDDWTPEWRAVAMELERHLPHYVTERWILPLVGEVQGANLVLAAPDDIHAEQVKAKLLAPLQRAARKAIGLAGEVVVGVAMPQSGPLTAAGGQA